MPSSNRLSPQAQEALCTMGQNAIKYIIDELKSEKLQKDLVILQKDSIISQMDSELMRKDTTLTSKQVDSGADRNKTLHPVRHHDFAFRCHKQRLRAVLLRQLQAFFSSQDKTCGG